MSISSRNSFLWLLVCIFSIPTTGQIVSLSSTPAAVNDTVKVCEGTSVSFSYFSSGIPDSETWTFAGGNPSSSFGPSPVSTTYSSPGTYTTTLTTNYSGTIITESIYVLVSNDYPTVNFTVPNSIICSSSSAQSLLANASPTGGSFSGPGVSGNNFDPSVAGLGTHAISYSVTSPGGCTTTVIDSIEVISGPDASIADANIFGVPFSNCIGPGDPNQFDLEINNTSTTQGANTNYYIDWGDGTTPYNDSILPNGTTHSYMNIGNYQITVIVSMGGCTDTATYFVFNGKNPSLGLGIGGANGCVPFTLDVPLLNVASNPIGTIYTVDFGDGSPVQVFNHPPPDTISYTYLESSCGTTNIIGTQNSYHVQVTATNPCGSTQAIVSPVYVSEAPEIDFEMEDSTICVGENVQLIDLTTPGTLVTGSSCINAYSRQWIVLPNSGYTISDPNGSNPNITFSDTGFYQVSMVVGNPCGTDTATINVCVDRVPEIDLSVSVSGECLPVTIDFTNNTALNTSCSSASGLFSVDSTGSWVILNGDSLSSTDPSFEITSSGSYDFSYTVFHQCDTITWDTTIVIGGPPSLEIDQDYVFCGPQTITMGSGPFDIDVHDSLNPIQGWNWYTIPNTGTNFNGSSGSSNPTIDFDSTGTYWLVGEVWNNCGSATDTIEITILGAPDIGDLNDTTVCWKADLTYNLPSDYNYQWSSSPPGYSSTSNNPTFNNIRNSRTFQVIVTDSIGCSDTLTFEVIVNPNINISFAGNASICQGDSTDIQATISGGTPPYTFEWSPTSGLSDSTSLNPTIVVDSIAQTYTLTVTDSLGCIQTESITITPVNPPVVDAGPDTILCLTNNTEWLTGATPSGGTYSGNGIVDSTGGFNPSAAGLGTHIITYHYTDPAGCYGEDSLVVQVISLPTVSVGNDTTLCASLDTIHLHGSPFGGSWSVNQNGSLLKDSSFIPAFSGSYQLVYSYGNGSCLATDTMIIVVDSVPLISNIDLRDQICSGDSLYYNPTSTVQSATIQWATNYSGSITGYPTSGTGSISGIFTNSTSAQDSITYQIWAIGNTANSCLGDTVLYTIVVDPTPSFTSPYPTDTICPGEIFQYTPTSNISGTTFNWVTNHGPGITGSAGFGSGNIGEVLWNQGNQLDSIEYIIYSTGNTSINCSGDTLRFWVYVNPLPNANAGPDLFICSGDSVLIFTSGNGNYLYSWSPSSNLSNTSADSTWYSQTTTSTTFDTIILTVTDQTTGCINRDTMVVQVNPLPMVSAGPDLGVCIGDSVQIGPGSSTNYTYNWSSMPSGFSSNNANPFVSPTVNTTYILQQTDVITGCSNYDTVQVHVLPPPFADFALSQDSGCSTLSITAYDSSSTGVSHEWFLNGVSYSTSQNTTFTLTNPKMIGDSTILVSLVVSAGTGCRDTATKSIVIHPKPNAAITSSASLVCGEDTLQISNLSVGNGPLSYQWSSSTPLVTILYDTVAEPSIYFPVNQFGTDTTITFTLWVESVNGCFDSTSVNVTWLANPIPGFSLPPNACGPFSTTIVDSAQGAGLSYSYSVSPAASITNGNTSSPTINFPVSNSDSVVYTITQVVTNGGGCLDSIKKSITIYPTPEANFAVTSNDSCQQYTTLITNLSSTNQTGVKRSSLSYLWTTSDGQTSTDSIPTFTFTNTGIADSVYAITLWVTSPFGCSDSITDSITVYAGPRAELNMISQASCAPFTIDTSSINATAWGNLNGSYSWQVLDLQGNTLSTSSGISTINHTIVNPGDSVIIRLIAFSNNGCSPDTAQQLMYSIENPQAIISATPSSGCSPLLTTLTDSSGASFSREWFINGNSLGTSTSLNLSLTNSGTNVDSVYSIDLIIYSGSGCTDTTSIDISVYPNPVAQFTVTPTCVGDSVFFLDNSSSPSGIMTWDWDFGGGLTSQNQNPHIAFTSAGTYPVTLTVTDSNGCSASIIDSVLVMPSPIANMIISSACGEDTVCLNQSVTLTDSSQVIGGGTLASWWWDIDNDGIGDYSTQQIQHTFTNPGYDTITLVVSTSIGCPDTLVKPIFVESSPLAMFNLVNAKGCGPLVPTVSDSSSGTITDYLWEVFTLDASGNQVVIYSTTQPNPNPLPSLTSGVNGDSIYFTRLTVSNCCGFSTQVDTIIVETAPQPGILVLSPAGCSPFSATFQLDGQNNGGSDYLVVNYGDGTLPLDTIFPTLQITPTGDTTYIWGQLNHVFVYNGTNPDTTYTITLTGYNSCGSDSTAVDVTVTPAAVQAFFQLTPQSGCGPLTVSYQDASYGATNVSWCFDFDTVQKICNNFVSNQPSGTFTYNTPGIYTVALFAEDGCSADTAYVQVEVFPTPVADFTHNFPICENDLVSFTNQSFIDSGFIANYYWDFGDGTSSTLENPTHLYSGYGTYTVSLVTTSSKGCVDSIAKTLTINESPKVSFSGQDLCMGNQPVQFIDSTIMVQGVISTTTWDFGDGNTSNASNPQHTYAAPGVYQVTLVNTTQAGCSDSSTLTVTIYPDPIAGFTTNQLNANNCGLPQNYEFISTASGFNTISWDFMSVSNPGVNTATSSSTSFTYTQPGVYVVQQIVENISGCSDTLTDTLEILPSPLAQFSLDNASGCIPLTVNFSDLSTYNFNGNTGIVDWQWNFGDGTLVNGTQNPTHVYTTPGVYHVTLIATSQDGCTDTITVSSAVIANSVPTADFTFSTEKGKIVSFINTSTYQDSGTVFFWDFGDGNTSGQKNPTHTYNVDLFNGEYSFDVCLVVTSPSGCADSICKTVELESYLLYVPNAFAPDLIGVGDGSVFLPKGNSIAKYRLRIFDTFGNLIFESTSLDENGIPDEPWNGQLFNHGEILPQGAFAWRIEAVFIDGTVWPGQKNANGKIYDFGTVTLIR